MDARLYYLDYKEPRDKKFHRSLLFVPGVGWTAEEFTKREAEAFEAALEEGRVSRGLAPGEVRFRLVPVRHAGWRE
jgi:hypothetical protein